MQQFTANRDIPGIFTVAITFIAITAAAVTFIIAVAVAVVWDDNGIISRLPYARVVDLEDPNRGLAPSAGSAGHHDRDAL